MLDIEYKDTWSTREEQEVDYKEYLSSDHWLQLKEKLSKRPVHQRCFVCHCPPPLEFHHRTYKRLGKDDSRDVIAVCRQHHQEIHDLAKCKDISVRIATKKVVAKYAFLRTKQGTPNTEISVRDLRALNAI